MKRFLVILTSFVFLFSLVGPIVADAKGSSGGGARGGSSFSSSKSSSSVAKPSSSSKATKADKAAKTSKAKKQTEAAAKPANVSRAQINSFKHKPAYSTPYAKPTNSFNSKKYESKSYYSKDNGFATTLMTAAGTYLVLDALLDDDEPVYIDSETGEPVDMDELEDTQPVDADDDSLPVWAFILFIALIGFSLLGLIVILS